MDFFKQELKRLWKSPYPYICIIISTAIIFVTINPLNIPERMYPYTGILEEIDLFLGLSHPKKLLILIAGASFVGAFADDVNSNLLRYSLTRTNLKNYSRVRVFTTFLSSFLVSFISFLIMIFYLSTKMPAYSTYNSIDWTPYEEWTEGYMQIMLVLAPVVVYSCAMAFWSVCGLLVSSFINNRFVAIISGFVVNYYIELLTDSMPSYLRLYAITRSMRLFKNVGSWGHFLYSVLFFVVLTFIINYLFERRLRKRVYNGRI